MSMNFVTPPSWPNPALPGTPETIIDAVEARDIIIDRVAEDIRGPVYAANSYQLIINCLDDLNPSMQTVLDELQQDKKVQVELVYRNYPYTVSNLRQLQADIKELGLLNEQDMVLISPQWGRVEVYLSEENPKIEKSLQRLNYSDSIVVFHAIKPKQ